VPSYDLCLTVSIAEIIGDARSLRELAKLGRPLVVSGHSAGGHLAACMLATDWRAVSMRRCQRAVWRGLRHFACSTCVTLVTTSINKPEADDASAKAVSPLFWKSPRGRAGRGGWRQ
jgi:arylformamidase